MALTYRELRALSVDELEAIYDRTAGDVAVGLAFVRDELARRESERREKRMIRLTWAIGVWTLANVAIAVLIYTRPEGARRRYAVSAVSRIRCDDLPHEPHAHQRPQAASLCNGRAGGRNTLR
jgi:hypothetical protein